MAKIKIKANKKLFLNTLSFIENKLGKPQSFFDIETDALPYRIMWIKPTEKNPYHILTTAGLHILKFDYLPKNVEGVELFVRLPENWDLESSDWPLRIMEDIVHSLLKGEVMNPGSTYRFLKEFAPNTKQCAAIVHYSMLGFENTVLPVKRKSILFLEIQTLYENEWDKILGGDETVVEAIYNLPYIDLNRKSFIDE